VTLAKLPAGFDPDAASDRIKLFYRDFFAQPIAVLRREADLRYLAELNETERQLAVQLLSLNLRPVRSAVLEGVGVLRAEPLVPALVELLSEAESLSRRLEVARALVRTTTDPSWIRPLLAEMLESPDGTLKEAHFDDLRLVPPEEQLEPLFRLLDDPDSSFVRFLALSELNGLEDRKFYYTAEFPHDAEYYLARRDDDELRSILIASASSSRVGWEVVF